MSIPKYAARDAELLTAGVDPDGRAIPQWDVARTLLRSLGPALQSQSAGSWMEHSYTGYGGSWGHGMALSTDCLRQWTSAGQCFYSDMSHWEGCTAESLFPKTYAAQCISALVVAEGARRHAENEADPGTRYILSAHNVDACDPGISWGAHDNYTVSTELWEDLFEDPRRPSVLGFVASGVAAAAAWFGAGLLLPLKDGTTIYSLPARGHHLGRLTSSSTTVAYQRGVLNSRREPHGRDQERLHLIAFDYQLASAALKCSFMQCLLAAAEEGYGGLSLREPIRALRTWSWNMDMRRGTLPAEAALDDGRRMTLPAYVRAVAERLLQMVEGRLITPEVAPQAAELLPCIIELTHYAERGEIAKLARHLDWAAKLMILWGMCQNEGARLGDEATRLADQDYANTDPRRGTFWRLWEQGLIDPLVDRQDVDRCLADGPEESRAWGRGRLIRRFGDRIADADWSYVDLRMSDSRWGPRLRVEMPALDSLCRARFERIIETARDVNHLEELLAGLPGSPARQRDPLADPPQRLLADPETAVQSGNGLP
jgi:hypothetical protein